MVSCLNLNYMYMYMYICRFIILCLLVHLNKKLSAKFSCFTKHVQFISFFFLHFYFILFLSLPQNVSHSTKLLSEGLGQLSDVINKLKPFIDSPQQAKQSVLLQDVNSYSSPEQSSLLHNLSSAGGYIQLFINLSKCAQVSTHFVSLTSLCFSLDPLCLCSLPS